MNETEYEFYLTSNLENRIRVGFYKEKGNILHFMIQYEAKIKERWHNIIRYDTSHDFAHIDKMYPDGRVEKQPLYFPGYNLAFVHATSDLKKNWKLYREEFERRMEK